MEIRIGDKVQIEGEVIKVQIEAEVIGRARDMRSTPLIRLQDGCQLISVDKDNITRVLERPETNAEKIARLERRVVELEGLVDVILPDAPINRLADHDGLSKQTSDVRVGDAQQSEYDKQPPCTGLATGMSRFERNMKTMFGPKTEAPWYPEQLEGYGPWIEGAPSQYGNYAALFYGDRLQKRFTERVFFFPQIWPIEAVAHCLKLP